MQVPVLFLCFWMAGLFLHAQTYRRYVFHDTPIWSCTNEIYGLAGDFTDTAQTVSLAGTGYTHGQYLNFVSTSGYSTFTGRHYKTDNVPLVPKSVYRTATHTYAAATFLRGSTSDYLALKFLNDGSLLDIKKVGEFPIHTIQAANILLDSLPGTSELLLCYHSILEQNAHLTSEIYLYSVDENLVPTGTVAQKLTFAATEELGYNIGGNCGLYLADSMLYFNLLMDGINSRRFETGQFNMYTGEIEAQWCGVINDASYNQRNRVVGVKNDTVYHLVNSCLAIYPPGAPSATYYPFDNEEFDCVDLMQTASGEWVGVFSNQASAAAIGMFNPAPGNQMPLYGYDFLLPSHIRAKGSLFTVWGKHKNCALALDEFTLPGIAQCHPPLQIDAPEMALLELNASAVDVSPVASVFSDVPLFEDANLLTTPQALCNTILSVAENEPPQFLIYPNPTTDFITVVSQNAPITYVMLRNMAGATVWEKGGAVPALPTINLSTLPAGLYTLEIGMLQGTYFQKIAKL